MRNKVGEQCLKSALFKNQNHSDLEKRRDETETVLGRGLRRPSLKVGIRRDSRPRGRTFLVHPNFWSTPRPGAPGSRHLPLLGLHAHSPPGSPPSSPVPAPERRSSGRPLLSRPPGSFCSSARPVRQARGPRFTGTQGLGSPRLTRPPGSGLQFGIGPPAGFPASLLFRASLSKPECNKGSSAQIARSPPPHHLLEAAVDWAG